MRFPAAGAGVSAIAGRAGYDFNCYDLHDGGKCVFTKKTLLLPQPAYEPDAALPRDTMRSFECRSDDDCISTQKGGCAIKSLFPNQGGGHAKCVCMMGPVIFGCLPETEAIRWKKAQER